MSRTLDVPLEILLAGLHDGATGVAVDAAVRARLIVHCTRELPADDATLSARVVAEARVVVERALSQSASAGFLSRWKEHTASLIGAVEQKLAAALGPEGLDVKLADLSVDLGDAATRLGAAPGAAAYVPVTASRSSSGAMTMAPPPPRSVVTAASTAQTMAPPPPSSRPLIATDPHAKTIVPEAFANTLPPAAPTSRTLTPAATAAAPRPPAGALRTCAKCGNPYRVNMRFCNKCGASAE